MKKHEWKARAKWLESRVKQLETEAGILSESVADHVCALIHTEPSSRPGTISMNIGNYWAGVVQESIPGLLRTYLRKAVLGAAVRPRGGNTGGESGDAVGRIGTEASTQVTNKSTGMEHLRATLWVTEAERDQARRNAEAANANADAAHDLIEELRGERDALEAEVDAMRPVVEAALDADHRSMFTTTLRDAVDTYRAQRVKPQPPVRNCSTCKHEDIFARDEPCIHCRAAESWPHWEPKPSPDDGLPTPKSSPSGMAIDRLRTLAAGSLPPHAYDVIDNALASIKNFPLGPDGPARIRVSGEDITDALHPNGRCSCFGEGQCEWCERTTDKDDGLPIRVGDVWRHVTYGEQTAARASNWGWEMSPGAYGGPIYMTDAARDACEWTFVRRGTPLATDLPDPPTLSDEDCERLRKAGQEMKAAIHGIAEGKRHLARDHTPPTPQDGAPERVQCEPGRCKNGGTHWYGGAWVTGDVPHAADAAPFIRLDVHERLVRQALEEAVRWYCEGGNYEGITYPDEQLRNAILGGEK